MCCFIEMIIQIKLQKLCLFIKMGIFANRYTVHNNGVFLLTSKINTLF